MYGLGILIRQLADGGSSPLPATIEIRVRVSAKAFTLTFFMPFEFGTSDVVCLYID